MTREEITQLLQESVCFERIQKRMEKLKKEKRVARSPDRPGYKTNPETTS